MGLPRLGLRIKDGGAEVFLRACVHSRPVALCSIIALLLLTLAPPLVLAGTPSLPSVSGLSQPASGPAAGGTQVTITGSSFGGATAVDFGSTAATDVTVNSAGTEITAVSPAGSGTVDVTVTTPAGTSRTSAADQFTYETNCPAADCPGVAIQPADNPVALGGGFTVTVAGIAPVAGLSAWTADIGYDPALFSVSSCKQENGSICNPAYTKDEVRVTGASTSGLSGNTPLATITFQAATTASVLPDTSPLGVTITTFTDSNTNPISATPFPGTVTLTPSSVTLSAPATVGAGLSASVAGAVYGSASTALSGVGVQLNASQGALAPASVTSAADGGFSATFTAPTTTGKVTLTAAVPGTSPTVQGSASVLVVAGPAAEVTLQAPAGVVVAGTATVSGKVVDQYGNGVPGATVDLSASAGTVAPSSVTTGSDGSFQASFTAPSTPQSVTVTAAVAGTTVQGKATIQVNPGVPAGVTLKAAPATVTVGGQSTISGQVTDTAGNAVSGATVDLTASAGALSAATATTDSGGAFSVTLTAPTTPGAVTVTAQVAKTSASASTTVQVTAGAPQAVTVTASPSAVTSGQTATLSGTVVDAFGNAVAGATVDLSASAGAVVPTSVATGPDGSFQASFTAPSTPQSVTVTAAVAGTSVQGTATIQVSPAPIAAVAVKAAPPAALVGQAVRITATVTASGGAPDPGVAVSFATSGAGSLSSTSGTTDMAGQVSVLLTDATAETDTVTASADGQRGSVAVSYRSTPAATPSVAASVYTNGSPTVPEVPQPTPLQPGSSGTTVTVKSPTGGPASLSALVLQLSGQSGAATVASAIYAVVESTGQAIQLLSGKPDVLLVTAVPTTPTAAVFVGPVVDFTNPDGTLASTLFNDSNTATNEDITITLPFNAAAVPAGATPEVFWLDTSLSPAVWTDAGVTILSVQDGTLTALLPHLSQYTVAAVSAQSATTETTTASSSSAAVGTAVTITTTVLDQNGQPMSGVPVSFSATAPGSITPPSATTDSAGVATATLTASAVGTVTATADVAGMTQGNTAQVAFATTTLVAGDTLSFSPSPVAASGSLAAGQSVTVTLTADNATGQPLPAAVVYLALTPAADGGSASVAGTALTGTPAAFTTDSAGQLRIVYTAPARLPDGGTDQLTASSAAASPAVSATDGYTFGTVSGLSITTAQQLPGGTLGSGYSATLAATGGTPPYTWSVAAGSALPPGLTLSAAGAITGSPTVAGTFRITVEVADSSLPSPMTATQVFTVTVPAPATTTATSGLPVCSATVVYFCAVTQQPAAQQPAISPPPAKFGLVTTPDGAFRLIVPAEPVHGLFLVPVQVSVSESQVIPTALLPPLEHAASSLFRVTGALLTRPQVATLRYAPSALHGLSPLRLSVWQVGRPSVYLPTAVRGASGTVQVLLQGRQTVLVLANTTRFSDIPPHFWARPYIDRLLGAGIVAGYPNGTFRPNGAVTRAEFAKMLVLTLGLRPTKATPPFRDVPARAWYAPYVAAAVHAGLIRGLNATTFGPGAPITREQLATLLARALQLSAPRKAPAYSDGAQVAIWAKEAVAAAVGAGYMSTLPGHVFAPTRPATRAQVAQALAEVINHKAP